MNSVNNKVIFMIWNFIFPPQKKRRKKWKCFQLVRGEFDVCNLPPRVPAHAVWADSLSESWFSLRCLDRNVWICAEASSEVSAFVLGLVLWLRCDGKEKAAAWQGLCAVEAWWLVVFPTLSVSCDGKHIRHVCRETILDRTKCIFSWQQLITMSL